MKILVVSDSHGRWGALYNVIQSHPDAGFVIHLGDGYDDLERIRHRFPQKGMIGVLGNCDFVHGAGTSLHGTMTVEGKDIFFTHGHVYNVKSGLAKVIQASQQRNAQICLYGHTHIPLAEKRDGLYILNPGSVGLPHNNKPTCGVIEITDGEISLRVEECDI